MEKTHETPLDTKPGQFHRTSHHILQFRSTLPVLLGYAEKIREMAGIPLKVTRKEHWQNTTIKAQGAVLLFIRNNLQPEQTNIFIFSHFCPASFGPKTSSRKPSTPGTGAQQLRKNWETLGLLDDKLDDNSTIQVLGGWDLWSFPKIGVPPNHPF